MTDSPRDRILAAISHKTLDRIATDYWGTDEVTDTLCRHLGCHTYLEMYDRLGIDGIVGAAPSYVGPALPECGGGFWYGLQAWGMRFKPQAYAGGVYWEQIHYPLAEAETIEELEAYPWPDPDWYDYEDLEHQCAQYHDRAVSVGYTAIFYYHNMLRGLEQSLMDPILHPEFTHCLVQHISDFFTEYHRRCFEAGGGLIDMTQVTDDWGSQHGLLTSPDIFEDFYRAPTQRAIDLAKSYGIIVFHHDDGDMRPLLPTLIEMGIDVLNPLQWRCGEWDLAALKAEFGDRICSHGGVDNQQTLPFGAPDDVRAEVKRLIETLACDRTGFIIAPCHSIQPNTPIENIITSYEAALRCDSWIGRDKTRIDGLIQQVAEHAETAATGQPGDWANMSESLVWSICSGVLSQKMLPAFAEQFRGMSESEIDQMMQSFALRNCVRRQGLVQLLRSRFLGVEGGSR